MAEALNAAWTKKSLCILQQVYGQANPSLNTRLKMGIKWLQQAGMRLGSHDTWRMPICCNSIPVL